MSVMAMLCEHADFDGFPFVADSGSSRYFANKYDGFWNDRFSSIRLWEFGHRGHIYAFETIDFTGRFASLNVGDGFSSSWWSYLGDDFNDVVSSSILVAREPADRETVIPLRAQIVPQAAAIFDRATEGGPVTRLGEPRIYGTFFPSFARTRIFATIELLMMVKLDITIGLLDLPTLPHWASVLYHIEFSVPNGQLQARAWRGRTRVIGALASDVLRQLLPPLDDAAADLNSALTSALGLFARDRYSAAYLLPGSPPAAGQFAQMGSYDDDVTLVVVA